jgi:predicted ATPase with chaperone activity
VTRKGTEQAREMLERSQYVGPAPVPLETYNRMVRLQGLGKMQVGRAELREAFSNLVVNERALGKIGAALNSGRSIFLYGPSGNGKTSIARAMARVLGRDVIYIPYAAEIGGQVIRVYDEFNHRRLSSAPVAQAKSPLLPSSWEENGEDKPDERWVPIARPVVIVGGELTLNSLDLIHDSSSNFYEAPYQMKANGGMFLIDDFGRQQVNPRDLLNRWIVPLETHVDYLSLHSGKKIEIPFEQLVVFATNIDPAQLVDAAFLRRIHHKIKVDDPSADEFRCVFELACQQNEVAFDATAFSHLMKEWYVKPQRAARNSHPRDIINQILDISRFEGHVPKLTPELVDRACDAYFGDL